MIPLDGFFASVLASTAWYGGAGNWLLCNMTLLCLGRGALEKDASILPQTDLESFNHVLAQRFVYVIVGKS